MKYGDRIAKLREEAGLTQEELSQKVGISRAALSHYEKNRREPDYDTLNSLSRFFKVSIDYLIGERDILVDDLGLLNKYYQKLPDEIKEIVFSSVDNFTLLTFRDIQKQNKERLTVYKDIIKTLQDYKEYPSQPY